MVEVYKFGGTCAESPAKIQRITELIKMADHPVVVTLSASAGITNYLTELVHTHLNEINIQEALTHLRNRHITLIDQLFEFPEPIEDDLKRLERLLYGIYYTEDLTPRTEDLILSFGERLIAPVLQGYLQNENLRTIIADPENFLITNGQYNQAVVLLEESEPRIKEVLNPLLDANDVIIVPGFYGVSSEKIVTLLGRSGTDYTATSLAYGLDASSITIWKDVYGFMSADPHLVPSAHTIPILSYQEAAELAYFGAKLLHPRAASPARLKHLPIYIRHIDHLDAKTCITTEFEQSGTIIKSVSHMNGLAVLKVYASIGGNTRGVLASIAEKTRDAGGNTISIATSQTSIAFLMTEFDAIQCIEPIQTLGKEIIDEVEIHSDISLICVVGEGLGHTPGIASKVFDAVSSTNVNVELISAGASSTAYHFTVNEKDLQPALQAIHNYFFEE